MINKARGIVVGAMIAGAAAQAAPVDHYTIADLDGAMAKLKAEAATTGSASVTLERYPGHFTMLSYRSKDGSGELHRQFADIFYIVRGRATLLTEGTLIGSREENPGEFRGSSVEGGKKTALGPGDIVHIPAETPHQLLVRDGDELLYFVAKVKERD